MRRAKPPVASEQGQSPRSVPSPPRQRGGDGTLCGKQHCVTAWPGAALAACAASLAPVYNTPAACAASTVQALEIFLRLCPLSRLSRLSRLHKAYFPPGKNWGAEGARDFYTVETESEIRRPGWNLHKDSRCELFREDLEALFPFLFTKFCLGKP